MVLKKEISQQIKTLLQKNPHGLSITDIVREIDINRNTAGRYLENLLVSGQVDMRRLGMAKIYMPSKRVPISAVLSVSSEFVVQLDRSLRILFANEPFLQMIGTESDILLGKNIEFTPVATLFDELFNEFIENIRQGIAGREWYGEIAFSTKDIIVFCRIAPTVYEDGQKGVSVILEDITQRRKAELKLEESERQFRLLAENSLDMIGRIKPDFTHIYASPAYTAILGYLPEELIGKEGHLFIHPDDVPKVRTVRNVLTEQNCSETVSFRVKHKNGHYIWIESRIRAIFDEKTHELAEYYIVTRDISQRKRAEDALQESEERYRQLVDISPDGVLVHQGGKIIFINPAALKILGASHSEEITGKNVFDFIHPDFRDAVRENIQKDLGGQISPTVETPLIRVDGTMVLIEGKGRRIVINGKPAVQVALRDITEQKRAEMALRESEATARALINAPTDSVILIDVEGIILAMNETAAMRFGKRSDELIGTMAYSLLPEDIRQSRQTIMATVQEKKEVVRFVDTRGGRWYDTVAFPILDDTGNLKKIAIIARDITEQKNSETKLRTSEQMYKQLLEQSFDAIAIHKEGKITFLNEKAAAILGAARPDDLIGKAIFDFIHPDSREDLQDRIGMMSSAPGTPVPIINETFFRTDGTTVTVEVMAISYNDNGRVAFRVAFREIKSP